MNPIVNYFYQIINIHIKVLTWPVNLLEKKGSNNTACFIHNQKAKSKQLSHKFYYDHLLSLFYVEENVDKHYFSNRIRGFELYENGLKQRGDNLASSYCLDQITFSRSDIVIDCGANYADLYLYLKSVIDPINYITFEPSLEEFNVIKLNAPQSFNNNTGLGNKNEIKKFYLNTEDGDSSFVEPSFYTDVVKIRTVTLSSFVRENKIEKIKLLKLEAEGFEPEILDGANDVLDLIEYIALDGGCERGISEDETFSCLTNVLIRNNFEILKINWPESRAIFRRTSI